MFLHTFQPQPILLSLGPVNIYWYGLFIVLGSLAAILVTIKLAEKYNVSKEMIIDMGFWLIVGGIIGARIYDVLLEFPYYLQYPINILKIWRGGLAIHGAILAGLIILWFYAKKNKLHFFQLSAIIVPGVALGQVIGRWGNYFNQELFGLPTTLPWGIPIAAVNRPDEFYNYTYFHPTFLYESLGNLLIFGLLISFHIYIIKKVKDENKKILYFRLLTISYLILYSILRFSLEFIRIDYAPVALGLRWPQVTSLAIIFLSTVYLLILYQKCKKTKKQESK